MVRISIEGNIGSGKSTVVQCINESGLCRAQPEPVDQWREWIKALYGDLPRWAASFCVNALVSFSSARGVHERSPEASYEVFAKNHALRGHMLEMELAMVERVFRGCGWKSDVVIYLRASPETCARRIARRNRGGEVVAREYLEGIHDAHEQWVQRMTSEGRRVHVVDANRDIVAVSREVVRIIAKHGAP